MDKWRTIGERNPECHHSVKNCSDYYFVYDLNDSQIDTYLNKWFIGEITKHNDKLHIDEIITLKKVNEKTSLYLYCELYNTLSIRIFCPIGGKFIQNNIGEDLYEMKSTIHSIDDSQYGIWWNKVPINTLFEIRVKLMEWIDSKPILDGDDFINFCVELGANIETLDYN